MYRRTGQLLRGHHRLMEAGAVFSPNRAYRYTFWRSWNPDGPRLLFVGLNPNLADAEVTDPTSRRCLGFARDLGYGSMELVNLFAWRDRSPRDLKRRASPVGEDCDTWILRAAARSDRILVAWGTHGAHLGRDAGVMALLGSELLCLGLTKDGHPRHPLYLPRITQPVPFPGDGSDRLPSSTGSPRGPSGPGSRR